MKNELDKIKTGILEKHYKNKSGNPQGAFLGGSFKICPDGKLILEMSGKINASPCDFGSITEDNIIFALERFEKCSGVVLDTDFILENAEIYRTDVKKDIILNTLPHLYLSSFRELFKQNTDKYHLHPYNDLKYTQGLELRPVKNRHANF